MFKPEILLVDDNPADLDLTSEVLARNERPKRVSSVMNGVEALGFLRHEGKYADAPDPDLIVLDLNLPRKDGRAVLAEVKADPLLRRTPIVVFSTSQPWGQQLCDQTRRPSGVRAGCRVH